MHNMLIIVKIMSTDIDMARSDFEGFMSLPVYASIDIVSMTPEMRGNNQTKLNSTTYAIQVCPATTINVIIKAATRVRKYD